MATYTETGRRLKVTTPLGADVLLLTGFSGHEAISRPFLFQLECVAVNEKAKQVVFDSLLGQKITVEMSLPGNAKRYINGSCLRVAQGARDATFTRFVLDLVPEASLLSRKAQSRIFQQVSVPDILKEVLAPPLEVTWEIQGPFEPRDYCVQYRESDFAFASRLMEEEGIYYFFKHSDGSHMMVVANTPGSHSDLPVKSTLIFDAVGGGTREEDRVNAWEKVQELRSGKVVLWDHCFELPHKPLEGQSTIQATVAAGETSHMLKLGANAKLELYDYPGEYAQRFDGINKGGGEQPDEIKKIFQDNARTADLRQQEQASASVLVRAASNCRQIVTGHKLTLERHFDGDGPWVVYEVGHTASEAADLRSGGGDFSYQNHFSCFPYGLPFRPPRLTPRPTVRGTQTAVVVGPPGEEIFTDKYGRIKVQFHWDRQGEYNSDSSCWIRVATPWAGHRWGAIHIPRIGQEVVVDFLEGDMDQPIVIGGLYNADCMPPYELPKYQNYSTMKSRSTKDGGNLDFNEFRYVDTKGKEQVFIHSQKRMDIRVKQNMYDTIGGSRNTCIGGEYALTVGGSHDLHVKGDVFFRGDGKIDATTGGAVNIKVGAASKHYVSAKHEINARAVTVEALTSIVLKVSGSYVEISPMGVTIQGPLVRINPGGSASGTSGIDYDDPLDCAGADTGEPGYLDRPYRGGGGGRKHHHEDGWHARPVTYNPATNTFNYGGSGVAVTGTPDFSDKALQALASLDGTPTGRKVIDTLQSSGHTTTIKETTDANGYCQPLGSAADTHDPTKGTDNTVSWNPSYNTTDPADPVAGSPGSTVILGHELIHADHNSTGTNANGPNDSYPGQSGSSQRGEERSTVGTGGTSVVAPDGTTQTVPDYSATSPTENSLRDDFGYPRRPTYYPSTWPGGPPW